MYTEALGHDVPASYTLPYIECPFKHCSSTSFQTRLIQGLLTVKILQNIITAGVFAVKCLHNHNPSCLLMSS